MERVILGAWKLEQTRVKLLVSDRKSLFRLDFTKILWNYLNPAENKPA